MIGWSNYEKVIYKKKSPICNFKYSLNISGTSTVNASDWSLKIGKFDLQGNLDEDGQELCASEVYNCKDYYVTLYTAELEKEPIIDGTKIKDFSISTYKPFDIVQMFLTITNTGTIPAKLQEINYKTPQYFSPTNNQNDIEWAKQNFQYNDVIEGIYDYEVLEVNEIICPGDSKILTITAGIWNADTLPSNSIEISNLGTEYIFVQADKSTCS